MARAGPFTQGGKTILSRLLSGIHPNALVGIALMATAGLLGILGLVLFIWSGMLQQGTSLFWLVREAAFALAAIVLPTFILSILGLLPVGRRSVATAAVGAMICATAVGVFVWAYPHHWNVGGPREYSLHGSLLYAVGLIVITVPVGSAMVLHLGQMPSRSTLREPSSGRGPAARPSEGHQTRRGPTDADRASARSRHPDGGTYSNLESECLRRLFREYDRDRKPNQ